MTELNSANSSIIRAEQPVEYKPLAVGQGTVLVRHLADTILGWIPMRAVVSQSGTNDKQVTLYRPHLSVGGWGPAIVSNGAKHFRVAGDWVGMRWSDNNQLVFLESFSGRPGLFIFDSNEFIRFPKAEAINGEICPPSFGPNGLLCGGSTNVVFTLEADMQGSCIKPAKPALIPGWVLVGGGHKGNGLAFDGDHVAASVLEGHEFVIRKTSASGEFSLVETPDRLRSPGFRLVGGDLQLVIENSWHSKLEGQDEWTPAPEIRSIAKTPDFDLPELVKEMSTGLELAYNHRRVVSFGEAEFSSSCFRINDARGTSTSLVVAQRDSGSPRTRTEADVIAVAPSAECSAVGASSSSTSAELYRGTGPDFRAQLGPHLLRRHPDWSASQSRLWLAFASEYSGDIGLDTRLLCAGISMPDDIEGEKVCWLDSAGTRFFSTVSGTGILAIGLNRLGAEIVVVSGDKIHLIPTVESAEPIATAFEAPNGVVGEPACAGVVALETVVVVAWRNSNELTVLDRGSNKITQVHVVVGGGGIADIRAMTHPGWAVLAAQANNEELLDVVRVVDNDGVIHQMAISSTDASVAYADFHIGRISVTVEGSVEPETSPEPPLDTVSNSPEVLTEQVPIEPPEGEELRLPGANKEVRLRSDRPTHNDLLDRSTLTDVIARTIERRSIWHEMKSIPTGGHDVDRKTDSQDGCEPLGILIDGAWGSGKSSIINFVRCHHRIDGGPSGEARPPLWVTFNVWHALELGPPWWGVVDAVETALKSQSPPTGPRKTAGQPQQTNAESSDQSASEPSASSSAANAASSAPQQGSTAQGAAEGAGSWRPGLWWRSEVAPSPTLLAVWLAIFAVLAFFTWHVVGRHVRDLVNALTDRGWTGIARDATDLTVSATFDFPYLLVCVLIGAPLFWIWHRAHGAGPDAVRNLMTQVEIALQRLWTVKIGAVVAFFVGYGGFLVAAPDARDALTPTMWSILDGKSGFFLFLVLSIGVTLWASRTSGAVVRLLDRVHLPHIAFAQKRVLGLVNIARRSGFGSVVVVIEDLDRCDDEEIVKTIDGIEAVFQRPHWATSAQSVPSRLECVPITVIYCAERVRVADAFDRVRFQSATHPATFHRTEGCRFLDRVFDYRVLPLPASLPLIRQLVDRTLVDISDDSKERGAELPKSPPPNVGASDGRGGKNDAGQNAVELERSATETEARNEVVPATEAVQPDQQIAQIATPTAPVPQPEIPSFGTVKAAFDLHVDRSLWNPREAKKAMLQFTYDFAAASAIMPGIDLATDRRTRSLLRWSRFRSQHPAHTVETERAAAHGTRCAICPPPSTVGPEADPASNSEADACRETLEFLKDLYGRETIG